MAVVCDSLKEYNQAKELCKKALTKKNSCEDVAVVAASYDNLALVYNNLGEYNEAKTFTKKL